MVFLNNLLTALQGIEFPGLLGLVNSYLDTLDIEGKDLVKIRQYLGLIRRRADGNANSPYDKTCLTLLLFRFLAHCGHLDSELCASTSRL